VGRLIGGLLSQRRTGCRMLEKMLRGPAFLGGILHTLPFLITQYRLALVVAAVAIAFELVALAWIRWRFFDTGFLCSFASITLGGTIIVAISVGLGGASDSAERLVDRVSSWGRLRRAAASMRPRMPRSPAKTVAVLAKLASLDSGGVEHLRDADARRSCWRANAEGSHNAGSTDAIPVIAIF
jgi:hypothetical protein